MRIDIYERPGEQNWQAVLDRLADRNEDRRACEGNAGIDVARVARCMHDFAPAIAQLPQIMKDCEVDATIIEQRQSEIDRLAASLEKLRGAP